MAVGSSQGAAQRVPAAARRFGPPARLSEPASWPWAAAQLCLGLGASPATRWRPKGLKPVAATRRHLTRPPPDVRPTCSPPSLLRQAEAEYCSEQAASRWRVLALVGGFDCIMFVVRAAAKAFGGEPLGSSLLLQLGNMVALYSVMALLNSRSRRGGSRAAQQVRCSGRACVALPPPATTTAAAAHVWRACILPGLPCSQPTNPAVLSTLHPPHTTSHVLQEELLLSGLIAAVISVLLLSLRPGNACDYVYAALFLTCTSSVLRLRWLVGTLSLTAPVLLAAATNLRLRTPGGTAESAAVCLAASDSAGAACPAAAPGAAVAALGPMQLVVVGPLQLEALVHILVAWAVGALMAYVSGEHIPSTPACVCMGQPVRKPTVQ